ncbi:hypothetical protein H0H87_002055, partial [Tephrocybe sp. NHM501043]
MQIRDRRLKKIKRLSRESIGGSVASVEKLIRLDPGGYVKGESLRYLLTMYSCRTDYALVRAALKGKREVVRRLLDPRKRNSDG